MEHNLHFTGTINRTAAEPIAWASERSILHQRTNIVMIVLDDAGYAEFGCYGPDIETPALDSLAADGLRYAKFHVTPLCSPTRTCLLTCPESLRRPASRSKPVSRSSSSADSADARATLRRRLVSSSVGPVHEMTGLVAIVFGNTLPTTFTTVFPPRKTSSWRGHPTSKKQ